MNEAEASIPDDDKIVEGVRAKLLERSRKGIAKYGATLDRDDLSELEWRRHFAEELMDAVLYNEKIIRILEANGE